MTNSESVLTALETLHLQLKAATGSVSRQTMKEKGSNL